MADLSIIVPVRNGAETLSAQLDALVAATKPDLDYEIVVADNGSTDETVALALSYSGRLPIQVIDASDAIGPSAARNRGVARSSGEWLLFCDADDEVDQEWMTEMTKAFSAGHELLAGPIDYRRLNPPDVCAWRGATSASVGTMLDFLPAAHSANLGVTRQLFVDVGGFDEHFTHGEDIAFIWRAELAGYDLTEVPAAIVHYRLRPTLRDLWKQSLNYGACEALLFTKFKSSGLRRRRLRTALAEVWWLFTRLPFALRLGRRGAWVRRLGQQVGRLRGAIRYRTWWW